MKYEYSDLQVSPWGGMQEMKQVLDKTGISKKLSSFGLPTGKSNKSINAIDTIESF